MIVEQLLDDVKGDLDSIIKRARLRGELDQIENLLGWAARKRSKIK